MAELEDLLIKVNSEVGDLGGIDKALEALSSLKDFSDRAAKGAEALTNLGNAFTTLNREGKNTTGINNLKSQVGSLTGILDELANHTKNADKTIKQLGDLGDALKKFAGLAESLKGLEGISSGVMSMVDVLTALGGLGQASSKASKAVNGVGKLGKDLTNNAKTVDKGANDLDKELDKTEKVFDKAEKNLNRDINAEVKVNLSSKPVNVDGVKKNVEKAQKEVDKAISTGLKNTHKNEDSSYYDTMLKAYGLSNEDFRKNLQNEITIQKQNTEHLLTAFQNDMEYRERLLDEISKKGSKPYKSPYGMGQYFKEAPDEKKWMKVQENTYKRFNWTSPEANLRANDVHLVQRRKQIEDQIKEFESLKSRLDKTLDPNNELGRQIDPVIESLKNKISLAPVETKALSNSLNEAESLEKEKEILLKKEEYYNQQLAKVNRNKEKFGGNGSSEFISVATNEIDLIHKRIKSIEDIQQAVASRADNTVGQANNLSNALDNVVQDADKMKHVLVVGSRTFNDYEQLAKVLDKVAEGYKKITIVSGGARGADALAKKYAKNKGFEYKEFPADWDKYGKSAGYRRNEEMQKFIAQFDDRKVVAFWDGVSKGTQHSIDLAKKYNNELDVIKFGTENKAEGSSPIAQNIETENAKLGDLVKARHDVLKEYAEAHRQLDTVSQSLTIDDILSKSKQPAIDALESQLDGLWKKLDDLNAKIEEMGGKEIHFPTNTAFSDLDMQLGRGFKTYKEVLAESEAEMTKFGQVGIPAIEETAGQANNLAHEMDKVASSAQNAVDNIKQLAGVADLIEKLSKAENGSKFRSEQGFYFNDKTGVKSDIATSNERDKIHAEDFARVYKDVVGQVNAKIHSHPAEIAAFSFDDLKASFQNYIANGITKNMVVGLKEVTSFDIGKMVDPSQLNAIANDFHARVVENGTKLFEMSISQIESTFKGNDTFKDIVSTRVIENLQKTFKDIDLNGILNPVENAISDYISKLNKDVALNPRTVINGLSSELMGAFKGLNIDQKTLTHAVWTPMAAMFKDSLASILGKDNVDVMYQSFLKQTLKDSLVAHGEDASDIMKSFSVEDYTAKLRLNEVPEDVKTSNEELKQLIEERRRLVAELGQVLKELNDTNNPPASTDDFEYLEKRQRQLVENLKDINSQIAKQSSTEELPWDDYVALEDSNEKLKKLIAEKEDLTNKLYELTQKSKETWANDKTEVSLFGTSFNGQKIDDEIENTQTRLQNVLMEMEKLREARASIKPMATVKTEDFGDEATPLENMANAVNMFDSIAQGLANLRELADVLHAFNGLDDNVKSLKDIAEGLFTLGRASQELKGLTADDLGFIDTIGQKLNALSEQGKNWFPVGDVASGLAQLINALDSAKGIDVGKIDAISASLKGLKNDADFMDAARGVASTIMSLGDAFASINKSKHDLDLGMDTVSEGFYEAVGGLDNVREEIEMIAQDFDKYLDPVLNSRLVELLETFRSMNDSYKNVSGIAQGLGILLDALIRLQESGNGLDTSPLDTLLQKLDSISTEQVTRIVENFGRLDGVTDSVARLLNAIKYFKFPLDAKQTVFGRLKQELETFNTGIADSFNETRSLLYGFKSAFEALQNGGDIPADNMFTKLTAAINDMMTTLDWKASGFKDISSFLYGLQEVTKLATKQDFPQDSFNGFFDNLVAQLNKVLDIEPEIFARFGTTGKLLKGFADIGNMLNAGVTFNKDQNFITDIASALQSFTPDAIAHAKELEHVFKSLSSLAEAARAIGNGFSGGKAVTEQLNLFATTLSVIADDADKLQMVEKPISAISRVFRALASVPPMSVEDNPMKTLGLGIGTIVDNTKGLDTVVKPLNSVVKLIDSVTAGASKVKDTNALSRVATSLKEFSGIDFPKGLSSVVSNFAKLVNIVGETKLDGRKLNAIDIIKKSVEKFGDITGSLKGLPSALSGIRKMIETVVANNDKVSETNVLTILADSLGRFKNLSTDLKGLRGTLGAIESLVKLATSGVEIPKNNPISQLKRIMGGFADINKATSGLDKTVKSLIQAIDLMKQINGKDFNIDPNNNPFAILKGQLEQFATVTADLKDFPTVIKALKDFMKQFDSTKGFSVTAQPINEIIMAVSSARGIGDAVVNFKAVIKAIKDISGKADASNLMGIGSALELISQNIAPFASTGKLQSLIDIANAMVKMKDIDLDKFKAMAEAIRDIMAALGSINGSNNTIKITLDERGIVNADHDIKSLHRTWEEFVADVMTDIQSIDLSNAFNVSGTTKEMKAELKRAEQARQSAEREVARWKASMEQTERIKTPEGAKDVENYRRAYANYWKAKKEADEYANAVAELNRQLTLRNGYELDSDAEGLRVKKSLADEKKQIEETLKSFRENRADMSVFGDLEKQNEVLRTFESRLEAIEDIEVQVNNELRDMGKIRSVEAIQEQVSQLTQTWEEQRQKVAEVNEEFNKTIGSGLQGLGGSFKNIPGLNKSELFKGFGDVFSEIGKQFGAGKIDLGLSTEAMASITKFAGTLGVVAGAIGMVVSLLHKFWQDLNKVRQVLEDFTKQAVNFAKTLMSKVIGAFNAVAGAVGKVVSAVRSGAEGISVALRQIGDLGKSVISVFSKVGNAFAPAMKGVKAIASAITPKIVKTLAESNKSLTDIIKKSKVIGQLMKTATRWFTMTTRMLMRRTITAFLKELKQAFDDLVVFEMNANDKMLNLETNVSKIFSGLRIAANQWIAAFEPLINAVTPTVLNFLRNVQAMGENVARFMAILTGQPYYIRAKQFYESYGKNVEETSKKVKDLTNGLDELNILNDQKNNTDGPKPEDMFEKVPIEGTLAFNLDMSGLKDIIDKIVDFLKNIDWEKIWAKIREIIDWIMDRVNYILSRLDLAEWLGKTLGDLVNTIFVILEEIGNKFDPHALAEWISTFIINALNQIDWDRIHRVVETWATKLAQFWNDIFAKDELWDAITKTITNFLNEVVHYFDTWARTFNFEGLARQLTRSLTNILENFDYEQLRSAVDGWVTGLADFINKAVSDKKFWKTLGSSIAKAINATIIEALGDLAKIDFSAVADSLKLAIENALNGIDWAKYLEDMKKWGKNIADFINGFFGDADFLTAITESIAKFANGILELLDKFLTELKGYDIGKAISDALFGGLRDVDWDKVFKIPAEALNALTDALRGFLDGIPEDFSLANWIIDHLAITYDTVDWDKLEKNLYEIGDRIVKFINDFFGNDKFWDRLGDLTTRTLKLVVKVTEDLTKIDWNKIAQRIKNYINNIINSGAIAKVIGNIGKLGVELIVGVDVVLTGVDWSEMGHQIAQGIIDAVNHLYINRDKIRKTIEDAFRSFSSLVSSVLSDMLRNKTFARFGTVVGETVLGIISGISIFFDANTDNIIESLKQFAESLAKFIKEHENEIVEKLNKIIDAVVAIIDEFFNEKGRLWEAINDVVERLNLGKLLGSIIRNLILKFKALLDKNGAIMKAILDNLPDLIDEVVDGLIRLVKYILKEVGKKFLKYFTSGEFLEDILFRKDLLGTIKGKIIGKIKDALLKLLGFDKGLNIGNIFDNLKITGKDKAESSFVDKIKSWWDKFNPFSKNKNKQTVKVPVEPVVDEKKAKNWDDLFDDTKEVPIELEDPKLGKITATTIEVEIFKGKTLKLDDIFADLLTVVDIVADKLTVKEVVFEKAKEDGFQELNDNLAGNDTLVQTGTLTNPNFDKIITKVLEVTENTTSPYLIIEKSIDAKLLNVDNIKSKLLDVDKIVSDLLEVAKIVSEHLDVDRITAELCEIQKAIIDYLEAEKIDTDELNAKKTNIDSIDFGDLVADRLNVDEIYAQTLNVDEIIADRLKVGTIDGNLVGGTGTAPTGTMPTGITFPWGTGTLEKPEFDKDDRWSDFKELVPSAEDFLDGIEDLYKKTSTTDTEESTSETEPKDNSEAMEAAEKALKRNGYGNGGTYDWLKSSKDARTDVKDISAQMMDVLNQMADGSFLGGNYDTDDVKRTEELAWLLTDSENARLRGKGDDKEVDLRMAKAKDWLALLNKREPLSTKSSSKDTSSTGTVPFLSELPLQTEYIMAEVYNIIDKWLKRIYDLFASFKVDGFLDDLVHLDDLEGLDLSLLLDNEDWWTKWDDLLGKHCQHIEDDLHEIRDLLKDKLDKLIGFSGGSDDTHLVKNTDAKSKNTKAVEALNNALKNFTDKLSNLKITCNCGDGSTKVTKDFWSKLDDALGDHCGHLQKKFDKVVSAIQAVGNKVGTIKCECSCCKNCSGCGGKGGTGTGGTGTGDTGDKSKDTVTIDDEEVPKAPTAEKADGGSTPSDKDKKDSAEKGSTTPSDKGTKTPAEKDTSSDKGKTEPKDKTTTTDKETKETVKPKSGEEEKKEDKPSSTKEGEEREEEETPEKEKNPQYVYDVKHGEIIDEDGNVIGYFDGIWEDHDGNKRYVKDGKIVTKEEYEKANNKKAEEAKKKQQEAIDKQIKDLENKKETKAFVGDDKEAVEKANKDIEEWRKKAKEYFDNIKENGTDEQKAKAESDYIELLKDQGYHIDKDYSMEQGGRDWYKSKLDDLKKASDSVDAAKELGKEFEDLSIGINGQVTPVSKLSPETIATAALSDRDKNGNEIYFYKKGIDGTNAGDKKDKITDPETIQKVKDYLKKKNNITDETPTDLTKKQQNALDLYKQVAANGDEDDAKKAKSYFDKYLAWESSPSKENKATNQANYLDKLKDLADKSGGSTPSKTTSASEDDKPSGDDKTTPSKEVTTPAETVTPSDKVETKTTTPSEKKTTTTPSEKTTAKSTTPSGTGDAKKPVAKTTTTTSDKDAPIAKETQEVLKPKSGTGGNAVEKPTTTTSTTTKPNTTSPNSTKKDSTSTNPATAKSSTANATTKKPKATQTTVTSPTTSTSKSNSTKPTTTSSTVTKPNVTTSNVTKPNITTSNISKPNVTVSNKSKPKTTTKADNSDGLPWWETYNIPDYVKKYKPEDAVGIDYGPMGEQVVVMKDGKRVTQHDFIHGIKGGQEYWDKVLSKYSFNKGGDYPVTYQLMANVDGEIITVTDNISDKAKEAIMNGANLFWQGSGGYLPIGSVGDWRSEQELRERLTANWKGEGKNWGSEGGKEVVSRAEVQQKIGNIQPVAKVSPVTEKPKTTDKTTTAKATTTPTTDKPKTTTKATNTSDVDKSKATDKTKETEPVKAEKEPISSATLEKVKSILSSVYPKANDDLWMKDASGNTAGTFLYKYKTGDSFYKSFYKDAKKEVEAIQRPVTTFHIGNQKFRGAEAEEAFDYWYKNSFLVKGYQMGGVPNSGEIFVARENGSPEFVGSFGNKAAVANNDQIVTAVANGVSMAQDRVVNAIESQTNTIENAIDRKDLDVQIGDRQIAEANRRGEKGLGQNFIS